MVPCQCLLLRESNLGFPNRNTIYFRFHQDCRWLNFRMREELNGILAARSGQDIEVVARDTDRDNFMSAQDAVEYGLIDEVLTRDTLESK